jgi:hypothetical protein
LCISEHKKSPQMRAGKGQKARYLKEAGGQKES